MTIIEGLKELKSFLSDKKRWTKGARARDFHGDSQSPFSEKAICWCLEGCIHFIAGQDNSPLYHNMSDSITEQITKLHKQPKLSMNNPIVRYNDHPNIKHHHVLNMIQKSIDAETSVAS